MTIRVMLFAIFRESLDKNEVEFELPDGSTVDDLQSAFGERFENVRKYISLSRVAVGNEFVGGDHVLRPENVVSFIPPVQGG
ncbi:MAG: MoaD/ThiS family protein [Planctomycetes bacterium]|nr:MoaD/ThiS family protein [Planctomycetota bacterium]